RPSTGGVDSGHGERVGGAVGEPVDGGGGRGRAAGDGGRRLGGRADEGGDGVFGDGAAAIVGRCRPVDRGRAVTRGGRHSCRRRRRGRLRERHVVEVHPRVVRVAGGVLVHVERDHHGLAGELGGHVVVDLGPGLGVGVALENAGQGGP